MLFQLLFFGTFYKYRIEKFYKNFVLNSELHNDIFNACEKSSNPLLCKSLVYIDYIGFFGLNIYWFSIMIKVLYKKSGLKEICEKMGNSFYENILTYTLFITSLCMIYFYNILNIYKDNYKYDIIGTFILGIASMNYHHYYSYFYKLKEEEYSGKNVLNNINFFTTIDQLCIKLRCILVLYSVYGFSFKFLTSLILHILFTLYFVYQNNIDYKIVKKEEYKDKKLINNYIEKMYKNISLCGGLTFIIDNIIMSTKSNDIIYCKYNILLGLLITMGFFVKPFYEINQIYIHVLLIIQSFVLGGIVVS